MWLFIYVLQAQFRYFLNNQELRYVIFAQISGHNIIMQDMNTLCKAEDRRVIAMTHEYFVGSGGDIHWVIRLVMGDGYFYDLQADTCNEPLITPPRSV